MKNRNLAHSDNWATPPAFYAELDNHEVWRICSGCGHQYDARMGCDCGHSTIGGNK